MLTNSSSMTRLPQKHLQHTQGCKRRSGHPLLIVLGRGLCKLSKPFLNDVLITSLGRPNLAWLAPCTARSSSSPDAGTRGRNPTSAWSASDWLLMLQLLLQQLQGPCFSTSVKLDGLLSLRLQQRQRNTFLHRLYNADVIVTGSRRKSHQKVRRYDFCLIKIGYAIDADVVHRELLQVGSKTTAATCSAPGMKHPQAPFDYERAPSGLCCGCTGDRQPTKRSPNTDQCSTDLRVFVGRHLHTDQGSTATRPNTQQWTAESDGLLQSLLGLEQPVSGQQCDFTKTLATTACRRLKGTEFSSTLASARSTAVNEDLLPMLPQSLELICGVGATFGETTHEEALSQRAALLTGCPNMRAEEDEMLCGLQR
mmetsp:Transcript_150538/g.484012  ORF Transcript_150538/g.484012 Transcript_150538/m.484012 type:complete len:367 (-) Transcript_150538:2165-3265(-)